MFKVLLVDDESWILTDLCNLIGWEDYGFEIIAKAGNGTEAEMLIEVHRPDLIISDIKMQGVSGIELLGNMKAKRNRHSETVLISAYEDFAYAQEAVRLGAFDYLLKPIGKKALVDVLQRAYARLCETRQIRQQLANYEMSQIILELVETGHDEERIQEMINGQGLSWIYEPYRAFVIRTNSGDSDIESFKQGLFVALPGLTVAFAQIGGRKWAGMIRDSSLRHRHADTLYKKLCMLSRTYKLDIGISQPHRKPGQFKQAYKQADTMADHRFITGRFGLHLYRSLSYSRFNTLLKNIQSEPYNSLRELIRRISRIARGMNMEQLEKVYDAFLLRMDPSGVMSGTIADFVHEKELPLLFSDIHQLMANLTEQLNEGVMENRQSQQSSNVVIRKIVQIIHTQYNGKLMIGSLAEQFRMNACYLSSLFKRETGKSFTGYLVEVRLNKAADLLQDAALTLYDVSELVGYDDYFHFSKLFKKYRGVSPVAYRKANITT